MGRAETTPITPGPEARASEGTGGTEALGRRLGQALGEAYVVERAIGHGGFAVVFRVRDQTLNRLLAVKVISPDLVLSRTVVERFRREAETIAQLSHAHIVPVHFVGQRDDLFYLAMAYVEGESLADRSDREGRLPIDEATRIFREVASALDLAHRRGVIHRDIKPHNILLERDSGRALLTDFGIARTAEGSALTATGVVVGTPAYMSPEQVTGETVDQRSDMYSLGCVAYQMLTGEPPFTGPTAEAVLFRRVAEAPVPVEQRRPDVPPDLAAVVTRCLQPDPAQRVTAAAEVVRALGGTTPVSGTRSVERPAPKAARGRWVPLTVSGVSVAVGAAVLGLVLVRGQLMPPERPRDSALPDGMVLIPGGAYLIGADDGHRWSRPVHRVTVDSFAIDRTEVSVAQYRRFLTAEGMPAPWPGEPDSTLPVSGATWTEAQQFCAWRVRGGRLPTEHEWEVAARGSAGLQYPWGSEWRPDAAVVGLGNAARPAPVGSRPAGATPTGVYDLIGNVWEWTATPMAAYPGGDTPPRSGGTYVIRGGAFNTDRALADATYRGYMPPAARREDLNATGFRCAVSLTGR